MVFSVVKQVIQEIEIVKLFPSTRGTLAFAATWLISLNSVRKGGRERYEIFSNGNGPGCGRDCIPQ